METSYNVDGKPVLEIGEGPDGKDRVTRSWEYDTAGNLKKAVAGGICYTYEYRADGKMLKKSSSGRTLLSCTYFPDGKLESLTDVSGKTVHYHYGWKGELTAVTDEKGDRIASYSHTPGGRLKEILHGNGLRTQYAYDTDGNIIRLRLEKENGETISDLRYEYDLKGNRTLKAGSCFTPEGSLAELAVSYHYDRMDRLISENRDGEDTSYLYDLCGNRLKKLDKSGVEEYHYNRKNQLLSRKKDRQYVTYQYDRQGNLLKAAGAEGTTAYTYNAFNQQTAVLTADGERLENQYDAEYLRAGTIENGEKRTFLYYQGELIAEADKSEEPISRYILGYGVAAGWNQGREGYYSCHQDEQNSTAYILGADGEIENAYQYDAFGVLRGSREKIHNRILYTGQQYDRISGQYYLRARYYNPVVGRFLQEDVYRGDGLNLYAYCENNPVGYYDPDGEQKKRRQYLGKTPGFNTKTGRQVLDQALKDGSLVFLDSDLEEKVHQNKGFQKMRITNKVKENIKIKKPDESEYLLKDAQMAHKNKGFNKKGEPYVDAVIKWNTDLKQYGPKSKQARNYMLDADNYEIDLASHNMSEGGKLKQTYDDPYTSLRDVKDCYPERKELMENKLDGCKEE